jgi:uncharacterized protein (DUF952 family)
MAVIYKILRRQEWLTAQDAGTFTGSEVDRRDGYIHFSTAAQAQETAQRHFGGQTDLVVLEIEGDVLGPALVWEPSRGGMLFPHLYGALDARHVTTVYEAPLGPDGVPMLAFLERP